MTRLQAYINKITNVYIVALSDGKLQHLFNMARQVVPNTPIHMNNCADSFISDIHNGLLCDTTGTESLVILDAQLPRTPLGEVTVTSVYSILYEMREEDLKCPVIIVSNETVDDNKARSYYMYYAGSMTYHDSDDALLNLIKKSINDRKGILEMLKFERQLQKLVDKHPMVIEYGCHHIELKTDKRTSTGYTFHVTGIEDDVVKLTHI